MGAPSHGWRALAAFLAIALGVALLFALVALVALQPRDRLAWVQVPDLSADLRVDGGLQTKPLKNTVVAAVLQDQKLDGATASGLALAPALANAPQQPTVALNLPPAARPVTTPDPNAVPAPTPTPPPNFAITSANELVSKSKAGNGNNEGHCSQVTITASGSFTTNGAGGSV